MFRGYGYVSFREGSSPGWLVGDGKVWSNFEELPKVGALGRYIWVFPKIGVPQNGWFIREKPY